jgi:hypothetical protein
MQARRNDPMKRSIFSLASLSLVALSLLASAHSAAASEQVPFRGRLEGTVERSGSPPVITVLVDATGSASQLGRFVVSIPHEVILADRTATGFYHFMAANGDTLTAEFTGLSTPVAGTTLLYIVETATITGGTGRFAGATGTFSVERLYDAAAGTTIGSFGGTISAGGVRKR